MANNGQYGCLYNGTFYQQQTDTKSPSIFNRFDCVYPPSPTKKEFARKDWLGQLFAFSLNTKLFVIYILLWIGQVADESPQQQATTLQQLQQQQQARLRRTSMRRMVRFRMSAGSADVDPPDVAPSGNNYAHVIGWKQTEWEAFSCTGCAALTRLHTTTHIRKLHPFYSTGGCNEGVGSAYAQQRVTMIHYKQLKRREAQVKMLELLDKKWGKKRNGKYPKGMWKQKKCQVQQLP